jgi:hypothetical protein
MYLKIYTTVCGVVYKKRSAKFLYDLIAFKRQTPSFLGINVGWRQL